MGSGFCEAGLRTSRACEGCGAFLEFQDLMGLGFRGLGFGVWGLSAKMLDGHVIVW